MRHSIKLILAAGAASLMPISASAQEQRDVAIDVAFFDRVEIGDVEITPFGIIEDSRCLDYRLCFRRDRLVIAAILHRYDGSIREIPLRLDELTPVPGGALLLVNSGTPPVRNGAIPLRKYNLDIVFVRFDEGRTR